MFWYIVLLYRFYITWIFNYPKQFWIAEINFTIYLFCSEYLFAPVQFRETRWNVINILRKTRIYIYARISFIIKRITCTFMEFAFFSSTTNQYTCRIHSDSSCDDYMMHLKFHSAVCILLHRKEHSSRLRVNRSFFQHQMLQCNFRYDIGLSKCIVFYSNINYLCCLFYSCYF